MSKKVAASKKAAAKPSSKKPVDKKADILKKYAALCGKINRYATMNEFHEWSGITKDMVAHHHGSLGRLKNAAKSAYPDSFSGILDESIFNAKAVKQLEAMVRGCRRFVVTTAVTGCAAHKGFLASIKNYCEHNDAEMLVLLATDPAAKVNSVDKKVPLNRVGKEHTVDPLIPKESIVVSDVSFNSNIHIKTVKLSAKHIDPATGLSRLGTRDGSFVYASPKQRLKFTRNAHNKMPHAVMTTGALTLPAYETKRYMSDRTATIALHDHVMGAIVVEVENNKIYHFRQVQMGKEGSFVDLGKRYFPDRVEKEAPEAIVLGDWHSGETDPLAKSTFQDVISELQVPKIILHDCFNGAAVNHHEENDSIRRAQQAAAGKATLAQELKGLADDMNELLKLADELVVVKSNHDEWVDEYLRAGKFIDDPINYRLSLDLAAVLHDGGDPLEYGVKRFGLQHPERVMFLVRDEVHKIGGVELGAHGDGFVSGITKIENAYGQSVTGHTHAPEILRGAWVVGTLSKLNLSYNQGPSDWMHTSCLVYSDGSRQLINAIKGKWRLE